MAKFNIQEDDFCVDSKKLTSDRVVQDVQQVQVVHDVHGRLAVSASSGASSLSLGDTQGRKGKKLPRINMAFSEVNHEYITMESRKIGMSATAFVNALIDDHRAHNNDK